MINEDSIFDIILSLVTIIIYSSTIWLNSIDVFFRKDGKMDYYYETFSIALLVLLLNIYVKISKEETQRSLLVEVRHFLKI